MKGKFKVQAIRRIAGIIAILAIIGFSMAACGGDDGGGEIYGCHYSKKESVEEKITFDGPEYILHTTHYLLTISFEEAKANITSKYGQPVGECGWMGDTNIAFERPCVFIEYNKEWKDIRLIERTATGNRGFNWE